jgi:agmatinase
MDSTASYRPGARFGPAAIREASRSLEDFSPDQMRSLEECSFMDALDLELPFGDPAPALELVERKVGEIILGGGVPFLLGGEHLASLGAVRAALQAYPGMCVVHLDAHADLRDEYLGMKLSHATVMRRVMELTGPERIHQIGVRSCTGEEYGLVCRLRSTSEQIALKVGERPCYLSCDLDILDPSVLPGTGAPEPGGLSFRELQSMLVSILERLTVVGMDVVELAPQLDPAGASAVVAAKLVRECIIALDRSLAVRGQTES